MSEPTLESIEDYVNDLKYANLKGDLDKTNFDRSIQLIEDIKQELDKLLEDI